jgi:hypothetical protein
MIALLSKLPDKLMAVKFLVQESLAWRIKPHTSVFALRSELELRGLSEGDGTHEYNNAGHCLKTGPILEA